MNGPLGVTASPQVQDDEIAFVLSEVSVPELCILEVGEAPCAPHAQAPPKGVERRLRHLAAEADAEDELHRHFRALGARSSQCPCSEPTGRPSPLCHRVLQRETPHMTHLARAPLTTVGAMQPILGTPR